MATLEIGQRREDLTVILVQDDDLIESIRLQAGRNNPDGLAEGTPIDWPAGTAAWLEIRNKGSQTKHRWDGEVVGAYIHFDIDAERVQRISREAKARLWLDYPPTHTDAGPFVFARGPVVWDAT